jgi:hypothetical protein
MARPKRSIGSEGRAGNPGPPIPTKGITMKDKKEKVEAAQAASLTLEEVDKKAVCALTIIKKIKNYLERVTGADIDGDGKVGGGPMKMAAFLAVFGLAAAACVAGPANTNIAVWYGTESSPQTYIDGSGGMHTPSLGVSNITATGSATVGGTLGITGYITADTLKSGVISGDSSGKLTASSAITDATNALDVAVTALQGATNALDVRMAAAEASTNALDVRMAAAEAATNTLNDVKAAKTDVFGAPVIASEYAAGVLISTNVITLKNGAGDTTTDYAVARVWLAAAANAVTHDGTEIEKVVDKQDYWVVVTNAGTVTFVITEAATTTNTLSVSVGPNIDTETIPLTD